MNLPVPNVSSIFLSSFNMNGKKLSDDDAKRWLLFGDCNKDCDCNCDCNCDCSDNNTSTHSPSIHDADLIILSLQECPTYPTTNKNDSSLHRNGGDTVVRNIRILPLVSVFGPPINDDTKEYDRLSSTIQKILSDDHNLIVDIAMGEPNVAVVVEREELSLNCCSLESDDHTSSSSEKIVERWYGFIRLMIYAKSDIVDYILSSTKKHNGKSLVPILSPAGRKKYSTYDDILLESSRLGLPKERYNFLDRSPDKGGVCVAIPSLQLLVCSLHLCGTNKCSTMESEFDARRIEELMIIGQSCFNGLDVSSSKILGDGDAMGMIDFREYKKIVLGDLNFRVEVCRKESDKGWGGPDFQFVMDVINMKSKEELNSLFWKYDHLVKLLHSIEKGLLSSSQPMKIITTEGGVDSEQIEPVDDVNKVKDVILLQNVKDLFMEYSSKVSGHCEEYGDRIHIPPPTFSLRSNRERHVSNVCDRCDVKTVYVVPDDYANKRTPSWPDRILIDDRLLIGNHTQNSKPYEISFLRTCQDVLMSDHVPVCCFLQNINAKTK